MATVNVNRGLTDQFYRYKMPKLLAKVEGKGNGIKTVIVNMVEIAKALNRPPMYPTKYFGCVLGAQVNCDVKNERYIVNGSHESSKLQDLLDGFIKKYVLCGSCGNPETTLLVNSKKGTINATCKACGHLGSIASKDKLATYILKFPPDQVIAPGASITKKSKKKDVKDKNGRSGSPHNDSDELNDVTNGSNEEDDDDWCDNAVVEELTGGAKKLMVSDDLDKSVEERCQMFFDFVQKRLASMEKIDVTVQKDILAEAERLEIKDKGVLVLCEVLFKDSASVVKMIKLNRNLFFRFTHDDKKSQKYLIRGIELTIKQFKAELLSRVAAIFKLLYDEDLLDEAVILEWANKKKCSCKELTADIFKNVEPFIVWLREAEEESDEEDSEDDNVEVVYDERSRPDKIVQLVDEPIAPKISPKAAVAAAGDPEDEIDIDDI